MKRSRFAALSLLTLSATVGCGSDRVDSGATVIFVLDAPLCSSQLPVVFSIDSLTVAADTFTVNIAPNHTTSRGFATSAGHHTLGARVVGGYVWSEKSVTLTAGQTYQDSLPFYCS